MEAGDKFTLFAQQLKHLLAHARHNAHIGDHIGAIRQFNTDLGGRRTKRPHAEGDDVECSPTHRAAVKIRHRVTELVGVNPIISRSRILFF